ncbi:protein of unassigned function [Methylobacterium oryzae CBMB20]|uniref:Protein of unassigned function n=1 Tax=Methylobacterium oryzae CBMB20 TaxID=693986 RepID=A0A089P4G6_9HYPH|nr:protein of unassigned function [Methylobacterium oryzae CBMB20]
MPVSRAVGPGAAGKPGSGIAVPTRIRIRRRVWMRAPRGGPG